MASHQLATRISQAMIADETSVFCALYADSLKKHGDGADAADSQDSSADFCDDQS